MSLTFISAGAGSGKTYTLTQTLGALLNSNVVRPAGVIATTFTKKAATELRERVRQYLLEEGEFAQANAMGQARIGTVNSVCGSLLQRFAFEAGMPVQQQVIEEGQTAQLIREAIDAATGSEEVAELSRLAARLGIEDWTKEIERLVSQARANDIDHAQLAGFAQQNADDLLAYFPKPTQRPLTSDLINEINRALPPFRQAAANSTTDKTSKALAYVEQFFTKLKGGYLPWSEWIKFGKDAIPEKKLIPLVEPMLLIAQDYASHPQLHADLRDYLVRMFQVCANALAHYRERKLGLGVVDFTDQEHLLLKLLDSPEVADVLRDELDLLLVDEFQDTSPIQLALFLKLSQLAKQTYWVGDIKQAIYGFRGSDTALMQAILGALPQLGGSTRILNQSWRSRPALVHLVNAVFTQTFADTLPPEEIALTPQRSESLATPAFANWRLAGKNASEIAAAFASGVQKLLRCNLQIPDKSSGQPRLLEARDIAILCYSHDEIKVVASKLREVGIPVATSQPGLLATPEAHLACACLRRLNDSSDTLASAEIIALADSSEPETWLADRLNYLEAGHNKTLWRESGDNAHPLLAQIAGLRSELPLLAPKEALQRLISAGNLTQRVIAWQQDPAKARSRLANLQALLELAQQYEDNRRSARQAATISGLLIWLDEQANDNLDAQAEPGVNAVRVLTHHAAKGLEWPVVILNDLNKNIRSRLWGISTQSLLTVDALNPLKNRFIRYWPWPFGKQKSGIPIKATIEDSPLAQQFVQSAKAEARRLLYVSMTRAREMLILLREDKAKQEEWLETLGADWLDDTENSSGRLTLPDGKEISTLHWTLDVPDSLQTVQTPETPLHWFADSEPRSRQPLNCNPSLLPAGDYRIGEQAAIGQRMGIQGSAEWDVLGTAVHAAIAASFTDAAHRLSVEYVAQILANFGVRAQIDPVELLAQINALHVWIKGRWPDCKPLAEIPVKASLSNGQILNGRIDLLLETAAGYVLIDHKSFPGGKDQWGKLAQEYGGQLAAYAQAIENATGNPVLEQWLFLPVAGHVFQVTKDQP